VPDGDDRKAYRLHLRPLAVSANATNLASKRLAGVGLLAQLELAGWRYDDGSTWPVARGRAAFECYPYTTLVGAHELGYAQERPRYKRRPASIKAAEFRPMRAQACDDLISRLARLVEADPPLDIRSNEVTRALIDTPSPQSDRDYKHREDLIDAVLCAWTSSLWYRHGLERCQILGPPTADRRDALVAPARVEQRR
jgi:predicted RNase H-like nuclease